MAMNRVLMSRGIDLFPSMNSMSIILLIHLFLIIVGLEFSHIEALDFKVYYEAAVCWDFGCNPWQLKLNRFRTDPSILPFLYPPPFFVLFRPFLSLNPTSAYGTWLLLMELLLIPVYVLLAISVRDAGIQLTNRNKTIIFSILFLSGPTIEGLLVGQVQVLTASAMLIYWYSLSNRLPGLAGISLALACFLKPFLLIAILCAIWFREWRVIHYFVLTVIIIIFISSVLGIGIKAYVDYFTAMSEFAQIVNQLLYFDLSPSRFLIRWAYTLPPRFSNLVFTANFTLVVFHKITILLLTLSFFFIPFDSTRNRTLACGMFALLLPLCAPVIWGHYFIWSLFAYIIGIIGILDGSIPDKHVPGFTVMRNLKLLCVLLPLVYFYSCVYPVFFIKNLMFLNYISYWPCIIITSVACAFRYFPKIVLKIRDTGPEKVLTAPLVQE